MSNPDAYPTDVVHISEATQPETQTPASLVWLQAIDPRTFTPYAWEHGGMTRILFYPPEGGSVANVYRSVSHCLDGAIGLQDEIHLGFLECRYAV